MKATDSTQSQRIFLTPVTPSAIFLGADTLLLLISVLLLKAFALGATLHFGVAVLFTLVVFLHRDRFLPRRPIASRARGIILVLAYVALALFAFEFSPHGGVTLADVLFNQILLLPTLLFGVVVPIYEECFFRGLLLPALLDKFNDRPTLAYYGSALVFWIFHAPPQSAAWKIAIHNSALPLGPGPFLLGWVCAVLARRYGIISAIAFHAAANALGPLWQYALVSPEIYGWFYGK